MKPGQKIIHLLSRNKSKNNIKEILIKGEIVGRPKEVLHVWSQLLNFTYVSKSIKNSSDVSPSFIFDISETFYLANYKPIMQVREQTL